MCVCVCGEVARSVVLALAGLFTDVTSQNFCFLNLTYWALLPLHLAIQDMRWKICASHDGRARSERSPNSGAHPPNNPRFPFSSFEPSFSSSACFPDLISANLQDKGISFAFVKYNNLYLMACTKRNSNATSLFLFLYHIVNVFKVIWMKLYGVMSFNSNNPIYPYQEISSLPSSMAS